MSGQEALLNAVISIVFGGLMILGRNVYARFMMQLFRGFKVPIRLVPGEPAGDDPAIRIPPDGLRSEVPGGTGAETAPFASDGTGAPAFEKNLSLLRAGDSGQTFTMEAGPSACPDTFGPAALTATDPGPRRSARPVALRLLLPSAPRLASSRVLCLPSS